jgi:apolipoprotein D and lipocalin family protein
MRLLMKCFPLALFLCLTGCAAMPNVKPVDDFQVERYLGTWYEIARLDHSFERGLSRVTAQYSPRKGGGLNVVNRGYSEKQGKWKKANGRAYFRGRTDVGSLKVTFFWPFYGSYLVFALDRDAYQWALVSGGTSKYLWILSRTPRIPDDLKARLLETVKAAGYDTSKLIFVDHP